MEPRKSESWLVDRLLNPAAYPQSVDHVSLVQTHISNIFLAGSYAYKIKKPVSLGFLDYSTLERRAYYCRREVELNRRLCPDLYLGVQPIVAIADGVRIGGDGEPLEWCVVMKRLPEERLLSSLLVKGDIDEATISAVARKLSHFHAQAATGNQIDAYGHPALIRMNAEENLDQLRPYIGRTITSSQYELLSAYVDTFLTRHEQILFRRIAEHRIRDCHGDVHASSVCLGENIWIFDCIEFNDRFRYGDVAADVAFLAMDLERYGRADLAWYFIDSYRSTAGDSLSDTLLDFYACYRALVRAKVHSLKLTEPEFSNEEKDIAKDTAQVYVNLATAHAGLFPRPSLLLTRHPSARAQDLAGRFGFIHLAPNNHSGYLTGSRNERQLVTSNVDDELFEQTAVWLRRGRGVIVEKPIRDDESWNGERALAEQLAIPLFKIDGASPPRADTGSSREDEHPGGSAALT